MPSNYVDILFTQICIVVSCFHCTNIKNNFFKFLGMDLVV